jgi:hypothetical protein
MTIRTKLWVWLAVAVASWAGAVALLFGVCGCAAVLMQAERTAAADARQTTEYRHAMAAYRAAHPACEWCLRPGGIEVHHVLPVHVDPDRAADTNNMVALCERCHLVVGHAGNFASCWVPNLKEVVKLHEVRRESR